MTSKTANPDNTSVTVTLVGIEAKCHAGRIAAKGKILLYPRKGRHKYGYESIKGNAYSYDGKFIRLVQIIDRNNELYVKIAFNEDTSQVIKCVIEPLKKHDGH